MKKNLQIVFFIIIFSFLLSSCQNSAKPVNEEQPSEVEEEEEEESKERGDFTFLLKKDKSLSISIMDWDNKIDLKSILGEPLSENNELIGEEGDTFKGSKIKRLEYDGLFIELMSPKGNDNYYILAMTARNENYITKRNIGVGDSLEKVLKAYPSAAKVEIWEKDKELEVYRFINEGFQYIDFYITNETVNKIVIAIELQ